MYLLDTDICVYLLNERSPALTGRFRRIAPTELATSIINVAELRYGMAHSQRPVENTRRLEELVSPFTVLPFDNLAAFRFAELKHALASRGALIGPMDLLIAAIALANDATLVTNNTREFARVPGLRTENWL